MSDDRILAYLRSRGRIDPPIDFAASVVDAVADLPQRRSAWFAPLLSPAAAAVSLAAVAGALAFLMNQDANVGPSPLPSMSAAPSASAEPSPASTAPTPSPSVGDSDLLRPGNSMRVTIQSAEGVSGVITVERGDDVGGYPLVPIPSSESNFFIEVRATYELEVAPDTASWGELDWRVEGEEGRVGVEPLQAFPQPPGRNYLGIWPGATVPEPRYVGWIIFTVPRELADVPLELVYQPPGISDPMRIPLRAPAHPPLPVAAEWPRPDPVYIAQPGLPITVIESAEADALFVEPDTCTNPEGGYTVTYPDSWYTNTQAGSVPACSWFSPTFYELREDGGRPDEIAIEIQVFSGAIGFLWVDLYTENVVLDGFDARRYETGMTKDAATPTDQFLYSYLSYLDDEPSEGRKLWAFTGTDYGGDYEVNRAVLDRIMAGLEFTD